MLENPEWRGGAELDLDGLVDDGVLVSYLPLHTDERQRLIADWTKIRIYPWSNRRALPDLGLLQQPIHEVQDYFGESIAFYFAWLEHYSNALLFMMWGGIIVQGVAGQYASARAVYAILLAVWGTLLAESWKRRRAGLAHLWGAAAGVSTAESPRPEFIHAYKRLSAELRSRSMAVLGTNFTTSG